MAATVTGFVFFNKFKQQLMSGAVDLTTAGKYRCELHSSVANLSTDAQLSTWSSITGTTNGVVGSAARSLANLAATALSGAPSSGFAWDSDALVWTASATMTVKYAVFVMSLGAGTGLPVGYIQLVATDQEVTAGNTVTLTPNPYWFKLSG